MIQYRLPEEKEILLHYANKLNKKNIEKILIAGQVKSSVEAKELAYFFWQMVDQTVMDSNNGVVIIDSQTNLQSWCESIMQTLRSHFIATGYMDIWEEESDKA